MKIHVVWEQLGLKNEPSVYKCIYISGSHAPGSSRTPDALNGILAHIFDHWSATHMQPFHEDNIHLSNFFIEKSEDIISSTYGHSFVNLF